jgi:osmotically-inducible protein OsmY
MNALERNLSSLAGAGLGHQRPLAAPAAPARAESPVRASAWRAVRVGVLALSAALLLPACAPVLVGGAAVSSALMATDRRTAGTQVEDTNIELKAASRIRDLVGGRAHVNVTSYNRQVLLTGEASEARDRELVERAVRSVEGVRLIVNEIGIMGSSSLTSRSNDAILTARVKAAYLDAKDLHAQAVKVVTERSVVHLMGRVTAREADRATQIARGIPGVQKVVRVFELLSEAELANIEASQGLKKKP